MQGATRLYQTRRFWLLVLVVFLILAWLLAALPARAAEGRTGSDIVIGANEVIDDDLYAAGNTVTVDGTITGDLVAAAQRVTINGTIEGDVLAAAQTIVINGAIGDDLRTFGEAVQLGPSARVADDLAVGAASLEQQAGSSVAGDLLIGGYQALLAGMIGGNVTGGMNRLEVRGAVDGNLDVSLSAAPSGAGAVIYQPSGQITTPAVHPGLTIADSAMIGGVVRYTAYQPATIGPAARTGAVQPTLLPIQQPTATNTEAVLAALRRFASLLIAGLLLMWLVPGWTRSMAASIEQQPLLALARGLLVFVGWLGLMLSVLLATIFLAIVFGYLTLGGLTALAIIAGLLLNVVLASGLVTYIVYGSVVIVSLMAGEWLLRRTQPLWAEQLAAALIFGLVLYVALTAVPWLGPLVRLVVMLLGLGALWQWGSTLLRRPSTAVRPVSGLQPA